MKKIILYTMAAMLCGASFTSCSDYLDTENKSAGIDADSYLSTEDGIQSARAKAFYCLRSIASNYELNCAGTDLYVPVRGKDAGDRHRYSLNADDDEVSSYYNSCYDIIKYAYYYSDKAGSGTKGDNEGRFLKDYAYYLLTQQFGGVPFVDHYISDASRYYYKASSDSIYTVIESDLEDIYNNGVLDATSHDGSVSKQAVAALLAKTYLAHAWDVNTSLNDAASGSYSVNSTANFQKAAEWAVKAINGTSLTQSFEQKWSPSNEGNDEQIFSVMYDRDSYSGDITSGGHGLQNMFGDYYGDPTKTGYKQVGSMGAMSEKALYLWDKGDERYDATFMTKIFNAKYASDGTSIDWPNTGYYAYYNADTASLHYGLRYFPAYTTQAEAEAEFVLNKEKYVRTGYNNQVIAFIMGSPATQYTFADDGSYTKKSVTYAELCLAVNGGVPVKKWDDPNTECQNNNKLDYRDIVLFDLSDMYLTAAEAYLMAGDEAASLNYVNQVRSRAKATSLSSFSEYENSYSVKASFGDITPLDVILDERARELYAQMVRWVDLRRTKQLVRYNIAFNEYISSVQDMSNSNGEVKWYRPLPEAAISGNYAVSEADQNPGY